MARKSTTSTPAPSEAKAPAATAEAAGPAFIVTGPVRGFRRGGLAFGAEPRELTLADLGIVAGEESTAEQLERLLAILVEPKITVMARNHDGQAVPVEPELVEQFRSELEARRVAHA